MKRFFLILTSIVLAASMAAIAQAGSTQFGNTYQILTPVEPSVQLIDDALALGIDLTDAELHEARRGWWRLENAEYILSRNAISGHFSLLKKEPQPSEWKRYEIGNEPVSEIDLHDEAEDLLELLGVPLDEIREIKVERIVGQTEDEIGNDVGEPTTENFLLYTVRELDGYYVSGSNAKLMFSPEGELQEITIRWRNVDKELIASEPLIALELLEEESRNECEAEAEYSKTSLTLFYAGFAYVEANASEAQETFEMQYAYRCGFEDSPIYFHERSAIKR
ncbi:MAG: hypothetical protein GX444_00515 [Myxococcales bacterium]|nr:hypothetical protein [Myxococcales bacterium]